MNLNSHLVMPLAELRLRALKINIFPTFLAGKKALDKLLNEINLELPKIVEQL